MRNAIPLASTRWVAGLARRTTAVRLVLAAALAGLLVLAWASSRDVRRGSDLLPAGGSPIVALDLSWSVSYDRSKVIQRTMSDLASSGRRLGLILFSDSAYEAMPPGTRSSALRPFLRFFRGDGAPNPWQQSFSAGTRISNALDLARTMLKRDHVENGSVVLISDLSDAPNDQPDLARTLVAFQQERIPLRMVAVDPAKEDERLFRDALRGGGGSVVTIHSGGNTGATVEADAPFPVWLVVAIGLLVLLVALNEQALGALTWARRRSA